MTFRRNLVISSNRPARSGAEREGLRGRDVIIAKCKLHVFGGVGHSYTNRSVDALGFPGFKYNEPADNRAWHLMLALFDEVF